MLPQTDARVFKKYPHMKRVFNMLLL